MKHAFNYLCCIRWKRILTLLIVSWVPLSSYSQGKFIQPSFGLHSTGHKFFIDFVKEKNGNVLYAGIGVHTNALNGDRNGGNGPHFYASDFSQLLSYKLGYRKLIGADKERVRFYPYCELVLSSIGLNMDAFYENQRSGQALYVNFVEKNATPYLSANIGVGADIPINKNFSLLAGGYMSYFFFCYWPCV